MKKTLIQFSNTFKGIKYPTLLQLKTIIHTDVNSSSKGTEVSYYKGLERKINYWIVDNNVNILDIKVDRSINRYTIDSIAYITYTTSFVPLSDFKMNDLTHFRFKGNK